jgi:hypothetical protein
MAENELVPQSVRHDASVAYDDLYPAVNDARWSDAAVAGRRILTLLGPYPKATQIAAVAVEKAWAYLVVGMDELAHRRHDAAVLNLRRSIDLLPPQPGAVIPLEALNQIALTYADKGDLRRSADTYREFLRAVRDSQMEVNESMFWLALGRVLERIGEESDRVAAIHAYSVSLATRPSAVGPDDLDDRTHRAEAQVGIVRCSLADAPGEGRLFWSPWLKGKRWGWLIALLGAAAGLYVAGVCAIVAGDVPRAWSLLGASAIPFLVVLLPTLRKVSGPGWSAEMDVSRPALKFALTLKAPSGDDLPT